MKMSILDMAPMILNRSPYTLKCYDLIRSLGWLNCIEKKSFGSKPIPVYKSTLNIYYHGDDKIDESSSNGRVQVTKKRYNKINASMFQFYFLIIVYVLFLGKRCL